MHEISEDTPPAEPLVEWQPSRRPRAALARANGVTLAGALAFGALAMGAVAIGALAIGRLAIGRVQLGTVVIDNLVVRKVSGL